MGQTYYRKRKSFLLNNPDAEKAYIDQIRERVEELLQNDPDYAFCHLYRLDISRKEIEPYPSNYSFDGCTSGILLWKFGIASERKIKNKMETPVKDCQRLGLLKPKAP